MQQLFEAHGGFNDDGFSYLDIFGSSWPKREKGELRSGWWNSRVLGRVSFDQREKQSIFKTPAQ